MSHLGIAALVDILPVVFLTEPVDRSFASRGHLSPSQMHSSEWTELLLFVDMNLVSVCYLF